MEPWLQRAKRSPRKSRRGPAWRRAGRRGEFAFRVGRREIGHLHGDRAAHFSFPKGVWAELIEAGRVVPHPVFPDAEGPAAHRIADEGDVLEVIALMR